MGCSLSIDAAQCFGGAPRPHTEPGEHEMLRKARPVPDGGSSHSPGTQTVWTYVFIDMVSFLLIFIVFMSERMRRFELYNVSQHQLNELFGLANALIMITSSWMVVEAIHAARRKVSRHVSRYLTLALLLGGAFAINKLIEYYTKFESGITPASNPFFSLYFFITGLHLLHVLVGMLFIYHYRKNARACVKSAGYLAGLENVGLYWHYVDILWVFIFPLLYLVGR